MQLRWIGRVPVRLAVPVVVLDGHEVHDGNDTCGRGEGGLQDIGVLHVRLRGSVYPAGPDAEPAADVLVEDRGKDARRVETGQAQPVDRAVHTDQCRRRHVAYESVVVQVDLLRSGVARISTLASSRWGRNLGVGRGTCISLVGKALSIIPAKAGIQGWWGRSRRNCLLTWDRLVTAPLAV